MSKLIQHYNPFLPSTVRSWNNLPIEVRQFASVSSFKQFLNKDKSPVPKYYYLDSRKGQILHARLRASGSASNLDLFVKNITDSPLCRCGSNKDIQQFFIFFYCPYFQAQPLDLLNAISHFRHIIFCYTAIKHYHLR